MLMIGSSKHDRENYPRKYFWTQEKERGFNPGLSANRPEQLQHLLTRGGCYTIRAVSLFSWSVNQNARETQMTTRVTEGARRERHDKSFSSRSAALLSRVSGLRRSTLARARALPLLNLKKRDCSQSYYIMFYCSFVVWGRRSSLRTCPLPIIPLCLSRLVHS